MTKRVVELIVIMIEWSKEAGADHKVVVTTKKVGELFYLENMNDQTFDWGNYCGFIRRFNG